VEVPGLCLQALKAEYYVKGEVLTMKETKKRKIALAWVLILTMMISVLPVSAFPDGSEAYSDTSAVETPANEPGEGSDDESAVYDSEGNDEDAYGMNNDVDNDEYGEGWAGSPFMSLGEETVFVTITFGTAGGRPMESGHESRRIASGAYIGGDMPLAPMRSGHIFARWEFGDGTLFGANTPVYEDVTVFARWSHTVTFESNLPLVNLNQGTDQNNPAHFLPRNVLAFTPPRSFEETLGIAWPNDPAAPLGHEFLGWYNMPIAINTEDTDLPSGAVRFTADTPISESVVLHGRWETLGLYNTVTFDPGVGEIPSSHSNTRLAISGHSISDSWSSGLVNQGVLWSQSAPLVTPPAGMVLEGWWTAPGGPAGGGTRFAAPGRTGAAGDVQLNPVNSINHLNFTGNATAAVNDDMTVYAHYVYRVVFVPGAGTSMTPAAFNNFRVRDIQPTDIAAGPVTVGEHGRWQVRTPGGANGAPTGALHTGFPPDLPALAPTTTVFAWEFLGWFAGEAPAAQGWTVTSQLICTDEDCTHEDLTCWYIPTPSLPADLEARRFTADTVVTESMVVHGHWFRVLRGGSGGGGGGGTLPNWEVRFFPEGGQWGVRLRPEHSFPADDNANNPLAPATPPGFRTEGYLPHRDNPDIPDPRMLWLGEHVFRHIDGALSVAMDRMPPLPVREGYVFMGWYTERDGAGTRFVGSHLVPTEIELEVYAYWRPYFTVSFDPNGGSLNNTNDPRLPAYSGPRRIAQGSTFADMHTLWSTSNSANPGFLGQHYQGTEFGVTRLGHTFIGWNTAADGSGTAFNMNTNSPAPGMPVTAVNGDITLYAQWASNVTFNRNHTNADNATVGTRMIVTGRNFINNQHNLNNPFTVQLFPDARLGANLPQGYGHVAALNRTGYVFLGFNTERDGSGYLFNRATVVEGPITVFAQWQRINGNIVFSSGVAPEHVISQANRYRTLNFNAGPVALGDDMPDPPEWSGHIFRGWNSLPNGRGLTYEYDVSIAGPRTIFAVWAASVRFFANGDGASLVVGPNQQASTVQDLGIPLGQMLLSPAVRSNWNFSHWNDMQDGSGSIFEANTPIMTATDLFAQWEADVIFHLNGGNIDDNTDNIELVVREGGTVGINMPADPVRYGYDFTGWAIYGNISEVFEPNSVIDSGHTNVVAIWSSLTETPTPPGSGNGGSGNGGDGSGTDEGTTVTPPTTPPTVGTLIPGEVEGMYIELDDTGVPLGTWEFDEDEEMWIFDHAVPLAAMPQTGLADMSSILLSLIGLAFTIVVGTIAMIKREKKKSVER